MSFTVTSPYAPRTFTEQSDCPMAAQSFNELITAHFEAKKTPSPYFLILIEDIKKNSALCDADQTHAWVTNNFTNHRPGKRRLKSRE